MDDFTIFETCGFDGCSSYATAAGLCGTHQTQKYARGALTPKYAGGEDRVCSFSGCGRVTMGGELCRGHWQQTVRRGGVLKPLPEKPPTPCCEDGCVRVAHMKGLCSKHYQDKWKNSRPDCQFEGCSGKDVSKGLCSAHAAQRRKGRVLTPLRPHSRGGKTTKCWVNWCVSVARGNYGICTMHEQRRNKYNLSDKQLQELPGECEACGKTSGLCVDHDHSCCPGATSCGKCVRGVLCRECNLALGYAHDDQGILESLIRYVRATT